MQATSVMILPGNVSPLCQPISTPCHRGVIDEYGHLLDNPESKRLLQGRKVLLASTDVHAHAIKIIHELLSRAGMHITNLGAEVNPDKIARGSQNR